MRGVDAVLARIGPGFLQQAYVVDDLEAAQEAFTAIVGCPRWTTFPAVGMPYRYRGHDVEAAVALAFGRSGRVQIELLQPIEGEGLLHEFMGEHGPGAHHLGFLVPDLDTAIEAAEADGVDVVMSGSIGTLRFAYLETFDALGIYLEAIYDPDGLIATLTP